MDALLVINPGSASRKYAVYQAGELLCGYHFEYENNAIVGRKVVGQQTTNIAARLQSLDGCLGVLAADCQRGEVNITRVGVRLVAPGGFFLQDRLVDDAVVEKLNQLAQVAPLHITVLLHELNSIRQLLPNALIVGVSDSSFHATKIEEAWNYGLPLELTDQYEIKRFGYHGISVASAVAMLAVTKHLPSKLIVCHLGSGSSVTAVMNGKSYDTTMGYSPFEGLIMATRAGSVDYMALQVLQNHLQIDNAAMLDKLAKASGLLGLSGFSDDLRLVIDKMNAGDHRSKLAVMTMAYRIVTAIGGMVAAMNGVDGLVFTGTIGERSATLRQIIVPQLNFLGFTLDSQLNQAIINPTKLELLSRSDSKPIYAVPTDENQEIARRTANFMNA